MTEASLESATQALLRPDTAAADVVAAARRLHGIFTSLTGLSDDPLNAGDATWTDLAGGRALAPRDAARCVLDGLRTARFLRGAEAAILEARRRFGGGPIRVLYAGCGPFAPLAVPLMGRFPATAVQFTLLDIHRRSLDAVRRIVAALGLERSVSTLVEADAARYRHDGPFHVLIIEALQQALSKEPQVAITGNLAPQLVTGGLLVPERIAVDACLVDLGRELGFVGQEGGRVRIPLGRLLDLTATGLEDPPPAVIVEIPAPGPASPRTPVLLTSIQVLGEIRLADYESGLTYPTVLHGLGPLQGGERIEFRYELGPEPGFRTTLLGRHAAGEPR